MTPDAARILAEALEALRAVPSDGFDAAAVEAALSAVVERTGLQAEGGLPADSGRDHRDHDLARDLRIGRRPGSRRRASTHRGRGRSSSPAEGSAGRRRRRSATDLRRRAKSTGGSCRSSRRIGPLLSPLATKPRARKRTQRAVKADRQRPRRRRTVVPPRRRRVPRRKWARVDAASRMPSRPSRSCRCSPSRGGASGGVRRQRVAIR